MHVYTHIHMYTHIHVSKSCTSPSMIHDTCSMAMYMCHFMKRAHPHCQT